jgi:hypothetical protein
MATTPSMQVFNAACDRLASLMKPHGFACRKSKRDLRRPGKLFEHIITFGTSRSINSIPGSVHLEVSAIVWSTRLAEYRKREGISLPVNEAKKCFAELKPSCKVTCYGRSTWLNRQRPCVQLLTPGQCRASRRMTPAIILRASRTTEASR